MNRPKWTPRNDEDRADLARMDVLAEEADRTARAVLEHAKRMLARRIPGEEVAQRARISKATLYRKLGRDSAIPNG